MSAFATAVGVDQSSMTRYESGEVDLPLSRLRRIATVLEVRVGRLLGEIAEPRVLSAREVLARESLRLYLIELGTADAEIERHMYWRAVDHPDSPITVEKWRARVGFIGATKKRKF